MDGWDGEKSWDRESNREKKYVHSCVWMSVCVSSSSFAMCLAVCWFCLFVFFSLLSTCGRHQLSVCVYTALCVACFVYITHTHTHTWPRSYCRWLFHCVCLQLTFTHNFSWCFYESTTHVCVWHASVSLSVYTCWVVNRPERYEFLRVYLCVKTYLVLYWTTLLFVLMEHAKHETATATTTPSTTAAAAATTLTSTTVHTARVYKPKRASK